MLSNVLSLFMELNPDILNIRRTTNKLSASSVQIYTKFFLSNETSTKEFQSNMENSFRQISKLSLTFLYLAPAPAPALISLGSQGRKYRRKSCAVWELLGMCTGL
jgi:hypothetical protein